MGERRNGWANYETWSAVSYMGEGKAYEDVSDAVAKLAGKSRNPAYELAGWLKLYARDEMCANAPSRGLAAQLFRGAFDEINFDEIARVFLADLRSEREVGA